MKGGKSNAKDESKALPNERDSELRKAYTEKESRELLFKPPRLIRNELEADLIDAPCVEKNPLELLDRFSREDYTNRDLNAHALDSKEGDSNGSSDVEVEVQDYRKRGTSKVPTAVLKKAVKRVSIYPEKAEELLLLLDTISIRLLQSESKFFGQLKMDITGARLNIDQAKALLRDIQSSMPEASRSEFIVDVGKYVESIFSCLEDLVRKLVKCHAREMCNVIDDLKKGLSSYKAMKPLSICENTLGTIWEDNAVIFEVTFAAVAAIFFCSALFLLTDPLLSAVICKFYGNDTKF